MAWQALVVDAVLGGASRTMSAISNKVKANAQQAEIQRQVNAALHENNAQLTRSRAAAAVRGVSATENINRARQADFKVMNTAALQLDKISSDVEAGFINAAMNTTITLGESYLDFSEQSAQSKLDQEYKSDTMAKTTELEGLAKEPS